MFKYRIIISLLISSCLIINPFVLALEVSDINENDWYLELIEEDNLEVVNIERRFKWYQEIIVYSDEYYVDGLNPEAFPNKIEDDYLETDFSEWDHEFNPPKYQGRTIESRIINKYRDLRPVRYLFFESFMGPNSLFTINNLIIFVDEERIDYIIMMEDSNILSFNNDDRLIIDLGDYYGINQLKIELYIEDDNITSSQFKLYLNESSDRELDNYGYYLFDSDDLVINDLNANQYILIPNQTWVINPIYQAWYYNDTILTNTYYRQRIVVNEKRYKDVLYRYFGMGRDYLEGYYINIDDESYQMDEEWYQDFYQYRLLITNQKEVKRDEDFNLTTNQEGSVINNNFKNNYPMINKEIIVDAELKVEEDNQVDENSFCPFEFPIETDLINNKIIKEKKEANFFYVYLMSTGILIVFSLLIIKRRSYKFVG